MKIKLSFCICGHPKRNETIRKMSNSLSSSSFTVSLDTLGIGCYQNMKKAWLSFPPDATHHCVLQDDLKLCQNFAETAQLLAEIRPHSRIHLFNYTKHPDSVHWIKCNIISQSQAILMPVEMIKQMIEWDSQHIINAPLFPLDHLWNTDDMHWNLWEAHAHPDLWMVNPSIVQHLGATKSLSLLDDSIKAAGFSHNFHSGDGLEINWRDLSHISYSPVAPSQVINQYKNYLVRSSG